MFLILCRDDNGKLYKWKTDDVKHTLQVIESLQSQGFDSLEVFEGVKVNVSEFIKKFTE